MHPPMPISPQPPALNPLKDPAKVETIDYTEDFENLFTPLHSIEKFIHTGRLKNDLKRYILGITKPAHQGQLQGTLTKNAYAGNSYKEHRVAELNVKLTNNQYVNFHNVHLVFLMKIQKSTNNAANIAATVMIVNSFFRYWIKEIDINRYSDEIPILPLINTVDIYKYSDAMLKFEEDDALKTYQHILLYSRLNYQPVNIWEVIKQITLMLAKEQMIISKIELINLKRTSN